jgi:16S rRNA (uracil1498-N3)-methyltransferase
MDLAVDGAMSKPPRFMITSEAIVDGAARVTGKELHHLRDVRRLAIGAKLVLIDEAGSAYAGQVERFEPEAAIIGVKGRIAPEQPAARVILAPAIIKGPRMEFLVEKAVELGASELWPLITARGVVRSLSADRRDRWRRLAGAAAKQSMSSAGTRIAEPLTVAAMLAIVLPDWLAILCAQDGDPFARIVRERRPRTIIIACGPEGDFNESERAQMLAAGFVAGALAPYRLRSETAALAALSVATSALHEIEH